MQRDHDVRELVCGAGWVYQYVCASGCMGRHSGEAAGGQVGYAPMSGIVSSSACRKRTPACFVPVVHNATAGVSAGPRIV